MDNRLISIVVPVLNEEDCVEALAREIREVVDEHELNVEVVFVDDGSTDASWSRITALTDAFAKIGGIRFHKNAGKAAALMAGFAAARGELIFTMDGDLQDPPEEIPRFIEKIDEGFDLVSGWKRQRHDPWHKVYPSRIFNKLIGLLTKVRLHDHVCGFKCLRRSVAEQLRIYGGMYRFLAVLAEDKGYKVTEIATFHRPRMRGTGKYGFSRFFKGFVDLITVWFLTRFKRRPQHLIGVTGVLATIMFFVPGVRILVPAVVLIAIGLVAEMIVASQPIDDQYIIAERAGWCAESKESLPNNPNEASS